MDNDGDAIKRDGRTDQTGALFIVLQRAAGQADVAAAFGNSLNAGAGAGGVIGHVNAFFFLKCFAERADDLFHRGRAVGRDRGSILLRTAYKRQRGEGNDKYSRQNFVHLFHFDDLLFLFV